MPLAEGHSARWRFQCPRTGPFLLTGSCYFLPILSFRIHTLLLNASVLGSASPRPSSMPGGPLLPVRSSADLTLTPETRGGPRYSLLTTLLLIPAHGAHQPAASFCFRDSSSLPPLCAPLCRLARPVPVLPSVSLLLPSGSSTICICFQLQ